MIDRWVNIFLVLTLVFVFILVGQATDHNRIFLACGVAILLSVLAFILNWLTIDGMVSAMIFGTISYGLGGITGAAVVLTFFISGSLFSKNLNMADGYLQNKFRRDGKQVWSNGFWFAFWIIAWFLFKFDGLLVAAVVSIATATADTWATEIGAHRIKAPARLITTGEKVPPGTDGGVSFYGTLAAFGGATLIALIFLLFELKSALPTISIILLTGFAGSFIDSYLGARFQSKQINHAGLAIIGLEKLYVSNNFVNWLSGGLASLIGLALILIIGI